MAKRGRKRGRPSAGTSMTFAQIAERLGYSLRTVNTAYASAIRKLKEQPGAYEGLLECVQAAAAQEQDLIRPGSVECCRDWIALFGRD